MPRRVLRPLQEQQQGLARHRDVRQPGQRPSASGSTSSDRSRQHISVNGGQMSDATTLLKEFLGNIGDPEKASAMFADDGAFEMPFFVSLGLPDRFDGPEGVKGLVTTVLEYYPDFDVKDEDITVLIETPDQVFAEYVTHSTAGA